MKVRNIFNQFCDERNIKENTIKSYLSPITDYCDFHNASIDELFDEAIQDEEKMIPLNDRRIRSRLLDYRSYLAKTDKTANTQRTYLTKIKSLYAHFNIQIPKLPLIKYDEGYKTNFRDLPTKDDIKQALSISNVDMKAVILFMASSGTAKAETLSLSVGDFINACGDYYNPSINEPLEDVLDVLGEIDGLVPTFYLKRVKTDKYYYTFCTPEASHSIIEYLKARKRLKLTDKLFDFHNNSLSNRFKEINDSMGWGFKGSYRFFRSHALRKFHASNIGLDLQYIDALQGRAKSKVHESYVKTNPDRLKKLYMEKMSNVEIYSHSNYENIKKDEFNIIINIYMDNKEYTIEGK